MTRFILVRHGESFANRRNIYVGHTDVPLEERGFKQAALTAEYIAENYKVDRVVASDLQRAFNTGKTIADRLGLPITPDPSFREIFAGEWENTPFDELTVKFVDSYSVWREDIGRCACPGGETVAELAARVMRGLERLAAQCDGETVVVATHATPIRAVQTLVTRGSIEHMKDVPWATNASVSVLEHDSGEWRFVLLSYDAHLGEYKNSIKGKV